MATSKCSSCGKNTTSKKKPPMCQKCQDFRRQQNPNCVACGKPVDLLWFKNHREAGTDLIVHECGRVLYDTRMFSRTAGL